MYFIQRGAGGRSFISSRSWKSMAIFRVALQHCRSDGTKISLTHPSPKVSAEATLVLSTARTVPPGQDVTDGWHVRSNVDD